MLNSLNQTQPPKIIQATKKNDLFLLREALSEGCDVNQKDERGWSALHYACALGYATITDALIQAQASLQNKSKERDSPIDLAFIFKHMNCLEVIKQYVPELDVNPQYQILKKLYEKAQEIKRTTKGQEKYFALTQ